MSQSRALTRGLSFGLSKAIARPEGVGGGALAALRLANSRLIDIVSFGDSNERRNGNGFNEGFAYAMSLLYPQYATGLGIIGANLDGYKSTLNGTVLGANTGLPSEFLPYILPSTATGSENPYQYYTGTNVSSAANGTQLDADSPLNVNANLRAHYAYGTFAAGGGAFKPSWRRDDSPFTGLVEAGVAISAQTGSTGVATTTLDLPAATRNYALRAQWTRPSAGTDTIDPNFLVLWDRVENRDRTAGWSYNSLYGVGGDSMYDCAAWLIAQSDASLGNYFTAIRAIQVARGLSPIVVMRFMFGMNDRSETSQPSLGPGAFTTADSPEAYIDNLKACIARIEAIWTLKGWPLTELYWLITPSHRISDPDDAELVSYRAAAATYGATRPRTSVVDLGAKMTYAEAIANSWYGSGPDVFHLSAAGYNAIAVREIA